MGKAFCSLQGKLGLGFPPARPVEKYKGSEAVLCSAPGSFPGPENTKRTPRQSKPQRRESLSLPGAERSLGGGGGGGGGGSKGGGRHWQMCGQLSATLEQDFCGSPCVTCRNGCRCARDDSEATGAETGPPTPTHPARLQLWVLPPRPLREEGRSRGGSKGNNGVRGWPSRFRDPRLIPSSTRDLL